jgi:hypothetical protein
MRDLPWIDRLAADLLATTAELRRLVRRHHYDPPAPGQRLTTRAGAWQGITIGANEARTLLRASMPATMALPPRQTQHADLVAALATFGRHLLDLNAIDVTAGPAAIAAAIELRDSLTTWCTAMQWHRARTEAHTAWPPAVAITAILRQRAAADVPELFESAAAPPARQKPRRSKTPSHSHQLSLLLPIAAALSRPPATTASRRSRRRGADKAHPVAGDAAA